MLVEDSRLPIPQSETVKDEVTLLLVIDDEGEQQRLTRALAPEDFRLLTAKSAADGFEILARHGADIVISASDLPGMNGIEFLTRVRKLYVNTVRVLASSGGEIPTLTRATNRAGIHLFLPRDWAPEKLCAEVRGAMESHIEAMLVASGQHPVLQIPPG
jgi:response regulator RpfG family c-di-GMP phosphodiesterase